MSRLDPVLRFPLSAVAQSRLSVAAGDITVLDTPLHRDPAEPPFALALEMRFKVQDPAAGPPRVQPLGPGRLTFIGDSTDPRPIPTPAQIQFDAATYATWRTLGVLCIDLLPPTSEWISLSAQMLQMVPTRIWYGPVVIPLDFLQTTLSARKQKIPAIGAAGSVAVTNPDWAKHAAARFLQGKYSVELRLGGHQADDDAILLPMPEVNMNRDAGDAANYGRATLVLVTGRKTAPFDGPESGFATAPGATLHQALPGHPANGCFPARHFLREVRTGLIGGSATGAGPNVPLADAALATDASTTVYRTLQVTRTWKRREECSIHFPQHTVKLEAPGGGTVLEQWLPSHGLLFVLEDPANPFGQLNVSMGVGPMRWLVPSTAIGATPAWRVQGSLTPQPVNFLAGDPHLLARLPMSVAMLLEKEHKAKDFEACTYYSLRRSLRALSDNRICGGRLNRRPAANLAAARSLLFDAWNGQAAFVPTTAKERVRDPATKQQVYLRDRPDLFLANGAPSPTISSDADINARNELLSYVLRIFFPDPALQHVVAGASAAPTVLSMGEMLYALWQTHLRTLHHADTRTNFDAAHIARGAAGSMVAAGLATYVGNHLKQPGETVDAYANRVTIELLALSLEPGALLQFWSKESDFSVISAPGMPSNTVEGGTAAWKLPGELGPSPDDSYGHSPVFKSYTGSLVGNVMVVIDQTGPNFVERTGANGTYKLKWNGMSERVWIAANWSE